jgi:hypothetical protein
MFVECNTLFAAGAGNLAAAFPWVVRAALIGSVVLMALYLVVVVRRRGDVPVRPRWNWWERLVYLGTVVSVAVLGTTAFVAMIRFGVLDGWFLFVHMFGAGALVAVLPLLAVTWSEANQFCVEPVADGAVAGAPQFFWLPKVMFWALLVGGFFVSATMLLSMLPLFGSDGLHNLLDVHRYSGLLAVVAMVLHLYGVSLQRVGLR